MSELQIDGPRLLEKLDELGQIGMSTNGVNRVALTDEDKLGRDRVVAWMQELDLEVRVDQIGNIFGIRAGRNDSAKPPLMTGSHIDSVIGAGTLDGSYGVLAALEVINVLNENQVECHRPIAVAAFTNEEGIRFQPDMMGSLVAAGGYPLEQALDTIGTDGRRLGDELIRIGYAGQDACGSIRPSAFIELHIEQGPVLDNTGDQLGIVQDLQGISWSEITIEGQANHAGTTPMSMRNDAGYAAASIITGVRDIATRLDGGQVATSGSVSFGPNAINVVPGVAKVTVDLRNSVESQLLRAEEELDALIRNTSEAEGVSIELQRLARFQPVQFDAAICRCIEQSATELGLRTRRMTSGAGHDAQMMARICPTAMIFVPSTEGISHNAAEHTDPDDLINGAQTLLQVLHRLATC